MLTILCMNCRKWYKWDASREIPKSCPDCESVCGSNKMSHPGSTDGGITRKRKRARLKQRKSVV